MGFILTGLELSDECLTLGWRELEASLVGEFTFRAGLLVDELICRGELGPDKDAAWGNLTVCLGCHMRYP